MIIPRLKEMIMTHVGQAIILIWGLIGVLIIGFAIFGYFVGELPSYVFLSFFPSAILADISIIIFYKTGKNTFQPIKAGWSFLCVLIMLYTFAISDPRMPDSYLGAGIFIMYPMLFVSFPSGFLWVYVYGGSSYVIDYLGLSGSLDLGEVKFYIINFVLWLGFFITGYLQWFKLLPLLMEKWQSRKSRAKK